MEIWQALAKAIYILGAQIPSLFMCSYYLQAKFLLESLSNNAEIFPANQPTNQRSNKQTNEQTNHLRKWQSKCVQ